MSQFLKTRRLTAWAVVVSAALLSAGCGGGNSAPKNEKGSSGFAVDGYLKDSTVLCDSNSNGSADTGETNVITNSGGGFVFPTVCTAPLVLIGGVSTDTNLPFIGKLKAPAGSKLITPLTTLMTEGMTQAQIISALGLLANTDVLNTDPAYAPSGVYVNDRLMKVTAATQLSVQKSTEIIAALAGGASAADKQAIYNEVMAAVVAQLKASNTSLIAANVVDQTVVAKLVEAATARIAQSSNVSAAVKAAASSINPASLGEVVAGGMKFQMEALLGAGQGLATATIVQSNDAKITAFVTANKPALAGAPSAAITTLGTTLTSQFSSTVTPPPVVTNGLPITFDNAAVTYTLTDFGGNIGSVVTDPAGGTNKVAKLIKGAAGIPSEVWAGTTISTGANNSIATIPLAVGATNMTMRVWSPAAGLPIRLKLEDAAVVTHTVETEAVTTVANGWQTLTFNFANQATGTAVLNPSYTFNKASVFANFGTAESGVTYYFDDLTFGGAVTPPVTATAPTTAAATPTLLAANVKSIYSDAYTQIAGVNLNPNWGQTTAVTEVLVAGNNTQKYATLNYQGIDFVNNAIDVSAMSSLHIDVWTANVTTLKVSIISTATAAETAVTLTPTQAGWNSFDIPLASYTAPDKTKIDQVKIEGLPAAGTLYFDNLYFWKAPVVVVATAPTTAAPTPTVAAAGVLSIYSDAYPQIAGVNLNPNWGQTTAVTEVLVAGNNTQKYATLNYQGIDFAANTIDVSGKSKLHIDVWSQDLTTVKLFIISAGAENSVPLTLTPGQWNSFDIDLGLYTVPNKTAIMQVKFDVLPASGTLYFDNLYFWGTAVAPPPVVGTFTGGIFADDYTGSLAVAQGSAGAPKSTLGGDVGFFYDGRLATTKLYDFGGIFNSASAGGTAPGAVHNFYYGLGLNSPAITDAYFGAFVNAPNNATADASAFTKVNVNFWGPAELFEKSFTPQVQVVLTGPPIAGCTSGSGRAEMQAIVSGLKIGAASTYIIPLTAFTMKAACGADTTTAAVWAHVGQVSVTLANTNVQYVVVDPNNANVYPNGLNIGSIKFN